jgi:hypothetical protein
MVSVLLVSMVCFGALNAWAVHKNVTVKYLIAALGTIDMRDRISVTAAYIGSEGMEEAVRGPMRNKGVAKFYIKDPTSSAVFELMYCEVNSPVFKTLVDINDDTQVFIFEGVKSQGEDRRGSIMVKSIRPARNIPQPVAVSGPDAGNASPDKYRIIMINQATSNRTVTADVELGEKYEIMGNTVIIENMNPHSNDVRVMQ